MNRLSIDTINASAPYEVWVSGVKDTFHFVSDGGIGFTVDFMEDDLLSSGLAFQLLIGNLDNRKSPRDRKVRDTVLAIVEEFFRANQAALLYICETGDGKQMARSRLFEYWFAVYEQRLLYTMTTSVVFDDEGTPNIATLILRSDNPQKTRLLTEFSETTDLLGNKPQG